MLDLVHFKRIARDSSGCCYDNPSDMREYYALWIDKCFHGLKFAKQQISVQRVPHQRRKINAPFVANERNGLHILFSPDLIEDHAEQLCWKGGDTHLGGSCMELSRDYLVWVEVDSETEGT